MPSQILTANARGVFAISATPFLDDGSLDLASTESLTQFYLDAGVHGLVILGMMGEANKLSDDEARRFLGRVLDVVGGRIPVIVGASNPGTLNLVQLSHDAMAAGAAGVMVAPVTSLRTDPQARDYFAAICNALGPDVPLVLQDFPLALGVHMSASILGQIFAENPQIVMFKHEDWPGLNKLSILRDAEEKGARRLSILTGMGGLHLPQELARGADGAMTGFCFPEMLVGVCAAYARGDAEAGEDLFDIYLPLVRHEAQPGIGLALRKEVLRRRGAIASGVTRHPGPKLTARDHEDLTSLLARIERRLATDGKNAIVAGAERTMA
ncbi:dihydrodipicolinate synthetase [Pararhizobium polonicum]|uniref:Dihydrodipicolinate synthetase n=1 Tax=Pararhizobium polonicum TaxID=1612624 RepID=A0A1C7NWX0_9HYPH|nr:dihydrodipicolinate synthase family protein [Pararhizobium polonicum]OBZ93515.1 dihydrodipicolinate synthetase [Pararhizobium polonicum]